MGLNIAKILYGLCWIFIGIINIINNKEREISLDLLMACFIIGGICWIWFQF